MLKKESANEEVNGIVMSEAGSDVATANGG